MATNERRSLGFVEVATDGILNGGAKLVEGFGLRMDRVAECFRLVAPLRRLGHTENDLDVSHRLSVAMERDAHAFTMPVEGALRQ